MQSISPRALKSNQLPTHLILLLYTTGTYTFKIFDREYTRTVAELHIERYIMVGRNEIIVINDEIMTVYFLFFFY